MNVSRLLFSTFTLGVAISAATAGQPVHSAWNVRAHLKPANIVVQSHRGAGELAPENTLQAFELGWKLGTYPECDVRTTKDGKIVTFHDSNFKRVVKNVSSEMASKGVKDLTLAELKKLDVGSWMGTNFVGRHVSELKDVFAIMQDKPNRHLYMDIKKVDFKKLAKQVKKFHVEKQVILASPSQDQIVEWKKLVPESDTLLWVGGKTGEEQMEKFKKAKARNFEGITQLQIHTHKKSEDEKVDQSTVNPFTVPDAFLVSAGKELRSRGILYQTLPYGGSTQGVYWKLLDMGLMSFATDHPKVTRKAIVDYYSLPQPAAGDDNTTDGKTMNSAKAPAKQ